MPFAQVHYPFENADWFEHHYPGDFIVEYIGADPRLVLHDARAGDGAVRPAGVLELRQPRHRARRRRPQDVEVAAQLPGPDRDVRHLRRRRHALAAAVVADPARRRLRRSPRSASATRCATCVLPFWNAWYFLTLYANAAGYAGAAAGPTRPTCSTATCWRSSASWSSRRTAAWTTYDLFGACETVADVPRHADELVHPPQPRPVLGRRPGRHRHPPHRARHALPGRRSAAAARDRAHLRWTGRGLGWRRHRGHRERAPHRLADAGRFPAAIPTCTPAWRRCATRARHCSRCARQRGCGSGCRSPRPSSPCPTWRSLAPHLDILARRAQRQGGRADHRRRALRLEGADAQPEDARAAPRRTDTGGDQGLQGRRLADRGRRRRGRWGRAAAGRVRLPDRVGGRGRRRDAARTPTVWSCSTPTSPPSSRSRAVPAT